MSARTRSTQDSRSLKGARCMDIARGLHRARKHLVAHARALAREAGLEDVHISMIDVLGLRGPLKMGDLAARMVIGGANNTRRAKELEHKGLVVRQRSEVSNREVIIRLTKEGEAFFQRSFRRLHDAHRDYLASGLTVAEQKQLLALLDKLE